MPKSLLRVIYLYFQNIKIHNYYLIFDIHMNLTDCTESNREPVGMKLGVVNWADFENVVDLLLVKKIMFNEEERSF